MSHFRSLDCTYIKRLNDSAVWMIPEVLKPRSAYNDNNSSSLTTSKHSNTAMVFLTNDSNLLLLSPTTASWVGMAVGGAANACNHNWSSACLDCREADSGTETEQIMSEDILNKMTFALGMVLIPVVATFGTVGNVFSLVTLVQQHRSTQQQRSSATHLCLAALAVSDLLLLLHSLTFSAIRIYGVWDPVGALRARRMAYPVLGAYGSIVCARVTTWLTAVLSVERCIAVYFPMKAKAINSTRATRLAIAAIYLLTALAFLPTALQYRVVLHPPSSNQPPGPLNGTNDTPASSSNATTTAAAATKTTQLLPRLVLSALGRRKRFTTAYGVVLNVAFRFVPLVVLVVVNALIVAAVRSTWALRRSMSRNCGGGGGGSGGNRNGGGAVGSGDGGRDREGGRRHGGGGRGRGVRRSSEGGSGGHGGRGGGGREAVLQGDSEGGGGSPAGRGQGRAERRATGRAGRSQEQTRITLMLLAVSGVFLGCNLPGAINTVVSRVARHHHYSRLGRQANLYQAVSLVTYFLETLNSSVNFVIYMAFSRNFYRTYQEIFCCRKRSRSSPSWQQHQRQQQQQQQPWQPMSLRTVRFSQPLHPLSGSPHFSSSSSSSSSSQRRRCCRRHYRPLPPTRAQASPPFPTSSGVHRMRYLHAGGARLSFDVDDQQLLNGRAVAAASDGTAGSGPVHGTCCTCSCHCSQSQSHSRSQSRSQSRSRSRSKSVSHSNNSAAQQYS